MQRELEKIINDDPDITVKKFIDFGKHTYPEKLKDKVVQTIEEIKDKCDIVLVGYGLCQSLKDLSKFVSVDILKPNNDDCISIMLTDERYRSELKKEAGTYFMTPGWCDQGLENFQKNLRINEVAKKRGLNSDFFLKLLFKNYTRVLYIDTGVGNSQEFERKAKEVAKKLKLKFEKTSGSLIIFENLLKNAKDFQ
jgi:hypothetical protein